MVRKYNTYEKKNIGHSYIIEVTETLQKQVCVEAKTPEDALKQVKAMYDCAELEFTAENLDVVKFDIADERM